MSCKDNNVASLADMKVFKDDPCVSLSEYQLLGNLLPGRGAPGRGVLLAC